VVLCGVNVCRAALIGGSGLSRKLLETARNFPNVAVYIDSDVLQVRRGFRCTGSTPLFLETVAVCCWLHAVHHATHAQCRLHVLRPAHTTCCQRVTQTCITTASAYTPY
jgi:hypothetical protein